jgi:putative transposase
MGHPGQPTSQILAPHDGWSSAFKGPFNTGDGLSCDAFTGADGDRRLLLGRQALSSPRGPEAKPVLTRWFTAVGLPKRLRMDHSVPCTTHTRARLAPLSAWWVRLGLRPECIEPGQPPPNGRHPARPTAPMRSFPPSMPLRASTRSPL